jgi:hypothetical protein
MHVLLAHPEIQLQTRTGHDVLPRQESRSEMSEQIIKQYPSWARKWTWTRAVFLVAALVFIGGCVLQYQYQWTTLQRYYLLTYVETWAWPPKTAKEYKAIYIGGKRGWKLALNDEIELGPKQPGGVWESTLLSAAHAAGYTVWQEGPANVNDNVVTGANLHALLRQLIYRNWSRWDFISLPAYMALGFVGVWLCFSIPADLRKHLQYKHGRRLKGPELVRTVQFNRRMTRWKWFRSYPPDGDTPHGNTRGIGPTGDVFIKAPRDLNIYATCVIIDAICVRTPLSRPSSAPLAKPS